MFRRKSRSEPVEPDALDDAQVEDDEADVDRTTGPVDGPWDSDDLADDGIDRVDLGSLLVAPTEGTELRLQVDEQTRRGPVRDARRPRRARSSCGPSPRRATATSGARSGRRSPPTSPSTAAPPPSATAGGAPSWSARCRS